MSANEKVKSAFEWIEHGRTISDVVVFLLSLGGGSVVRTILQRYSELPNEWLMPIWIFSTALILWAVIQLFPRFAAHGTTNEKEDTGQTRTSRLLPLVIVAIIAFAVGRYSADTRPTPDEWTHNVSSIISQPINHIYQDENVELDGKRFENSTFKSGVTFVYRGLKPYIFANNSIEKPLVVKVVEGPQSAGADFVAGLTQTVCRGRDANCDVRGITIYTVDDKLNVLNDTH